jgi:hypothetical protein
VQHLNCYYATSRLLTECVHRCKEKRCLKGNLNISIDGV